MNKKDEELFDRPPLAETVRDFLSASTDQSAVIEAELLLGGRQVTGEIRYAGVVRRLVDILNALDNGYLTMHAGTLRDCSGGSLKFDSIQIARNSILVAFPHQGSASRINPGEVIEKHRKLVTVVMPSCQVSGYFYVAPEVDPAVAATSAAHRFIALTHVTVTALDSNTSTRFESVAILNAAHADAYLWSDETQAPTSLPHNAEASLKERTVPSDSPVG